MATSAPLRGPGAALLANVAELKAIEFFNQGRLLLSRGALEEAVLSFQEAVFYAPGNASPPIALAEVYLAMGDTQTAVTQYRQAVWILTRRERERRRARAKAAAEAEREAFLFGAVMPQNSSQQSLLGSPAPQSCPNTSDAAEPSAASGAVLELAAVQLRLAGLLDALSLSLYAVNVFAQAHRFSQEALEVLNEAKPKTPPGDNGETAPPRTPTEEAVFAVIPTVELHKCIFLIALLRDEEAEFQLEALHKRSPHLALQTTALLTNLYVKRQAFRSARLILDAQQSSVIRENRSLTVAQHIFNVQYRRYCGKALGDKDLGTISQCIKVYPSDTELLFARAKIHIERGQHKRSVRDLFKCIKDSNGTHKEAVNTMTEVLIQIGKDSSAAHGGGGGRDGDDGGRESVEEAITYYSESLKWRADNTAVLLARADCYMRVEDYASALVDYCMILHLEPEDEVAPGRIAVLHDIWGRKFYADGKIRKAESEFSNAIKSDTKMALFYYHRALCRFELNEPRYALRDVLSCHHLNPTDPVLRAFIVRYLGATDGEEPTGTAAAIAADAARQPAVGAGTAMPSHDAAAAAASGARIPYTARAAKESLAAEDNVFGMLSGTKVPVHRRAIGSRSGEGQM